MLKISVDWDGEKIILSSDLQHDAGQFMRKYSIIEIETLRCYSLKE